MRRSGRSRTRSSGKRARRGASARPSRARYASSFAHAHIHKKTIVNKQQQIALTLPPYTLNFISSDLGCSSSRIYIYNYFFKTDFSHPQRAEADREIARLQRAAARAENDAATLRRRLEIEGDPVNELRQLRREIAALRGEGEGLRREARERSVAHRSVGNDLSIDL
jgi:hypothetical protein